MDYSKIVKRSWEITWQNKWLWVTGLVIAAFSGGSGSGGGGNSSSRTVPTDNIPSSSPVPTFNPSDFKSSASDVLGTATDYVSNWFASISIQNWVVLGLLVFVIMIISIAVVWVLTSWAKGALIFGFDEADNGKVVTLKSISPVGISNIKKLVVFSLISAGVSFLTIISIGLIVGLGYLLSLVLETAGTVLFVLLAILGVFIFIFVMLFFTMISIYAERLIILKGLTPWEAWKKGLSLSKGNFFPTLVMGIINSIIGFTTGCLGVIALLIIFAIPGFLIIYPIFKNGFVIPTPTQIISILVLVTLFGAINLVMRAIFIVFNNGNWNLFFKEILDNKEKQNE